MGGEIRSIDSAPTLFIQATMDPATVPLERIQVIKGWYASGQTQEKIYDVEIAAQGTPAITRVWRDPDFNPDQPAFYYVRVLEMPTPRHSTLDALALKRDVASTGHPQTIQERAYTSPVHYSP